MTTSLKSEPYPYLTTTEALEPSYYETLAARFPSYSDILSMKGYKDPKQIIGRSNILLHMGGIRAFEANTLIDPVWQEFLRVHYSYDFFRQIIDLLGDGIRQSYPDMEQRLGKNLEELTFQHRDIEDKGADLWVDIQFSINTPVREPSRVRARHVDDPNKLFVGLFYLPTPEDDSIGGDLEICRWRGEPLFKNPYVPGQGIANTHIHDEQSDLVNTVEYSANTLAMFVNSPMAIHGVTERQPTPHIRRYINIIAGFNEPLYDFDQYQEKLKPWALTMGGTGRK